MDCTKRNLGAVVLMVGSGLLAPAGAVAQGTGTKLTASDEAPGQFFGRSVSIDGDYLAVAAIDATYVFHRAGALWVEQAKLPDPAGRMAISANRIVIGDPLDDGVGSNAGAAVVFRREGAKWVEEARLTPGDTEEGDRFGASVAIDGDVIVAGAPRDDDAGLDAGAVYVFRWNGTLWVQEQKLFVSDALGDDETGRSLALSGDVLIIGASGRSPSVSPRKAYIFRHNGRRWIQKQELTATEPQSVVAYAESVALSGDVAVVGAPTPPAPDDGPPIGPGLAYVYRYNGVSWIEEAILASSAHVLQAADFFGAAVAVAVDGDVVVVGAPSGWDGGVFEAGTADLFQRFGSIWMAQGKLTRADPEASDFFGGSVAVSGNFALVGARADDDACPSDPFCSSGSAYVFSLKERILAPIDADFDNDDDTDLQDFEVFWPCVGGPTLVVEPACQQADLSRDGYVDLRDYQLLQWVFSGP